MLVLADVTGLSVAFALAVIFFRDSVDSVDPVGWSHEVLLFAVTMPGWILLARLHGLYDRDEERASHSTLDELVGVFHLVTVGAFLFFAGAWVTGLANPYPWKLLTFWALAIGLVTAARVAARAFARTRRVHPERRHRRRRRGRPARRAEDPRPPRVRRERCRLRRRGVRARSEVTGGVAVIGTPEELPEIVRSHEIERVVVAFFDQPIDEAIDLVRGVKDISVQIDIVPRLFAAVDPRAQIHTLEGPAHRTAPARHWRSSLSVSGRSTSSSPGSASSSSRRRSAR